MNNFFSTIKIYAILLILLVIIGLFGYWVYQKNQQKAAAEKQLKEWLEIQAQKDLERINQAKENLKQAEENTNQIRNANYSNVNDDELRRRIIEGTKNIK